MSKEHTLQQQQRQNVKSHNVLCLGLKNIRCNSNSVKMLRAIMYCAYV